MPNAPQPHDDLRAPNLQGAPNAADAPHADKIQPAVAVEVHGDNSGEQAIAGTHTGDNVFGQQVNAAEIRKLETRMPGAGGDVHAQFAFVINGASADENGLAQAFGRAKDDLLRGIFPRNMTAIQSPPRPESMPSTEEAQEAWFCDNLTPYERCYVRAAAILHGAPAYLVTSAAKQLYDTFHPPLPQPAPGQGSPVTDAPVPVPGRSLAANTFTEVRAEENARRLYWQDSDSNGSSAFGLMALQLIAREIEGTGGVQGQNSAPIIQQWATSDEVERSWRAAHALGVIWWTLDQSRVSSIARKWANAKLTVSHYSAAGLIFGAYETESDRGAKTTTELRTLKLLAQLAGEARQPGSQDEPRGPAHVVTTAYELIALVSIETALDGLDRLLGLAYQGEETASFPMTIAVFLYGALSYRTLACQGAIRHVLERLAQHAEQLTRVRYAAVMPSNEVRERCEQELEIVFFIFFFLVSSSFPEADETRYAQYGEQATLEAEPTIPDTSGRDVVLASVFADGEQAMRDALVTLICAGLLNGKAKLAVDTLKQWADHLFPAEPTTAQERSRWMKYIRFVVAVGMQSQNWDQALSKGKPQIGFTLLKARLGRWPANKPSGQLALEILG
ncbi:MAG TPA: hypothetical protein VMU62_08900, partial [Acidobacteriaceae bacterium]|nr:hypothetical protein [Acidobacteriaceae bacterium]